MTVRDAVHPLTPRTINEDVGRALIREMAWYERYLAARRHDLIDLDAGLQADGRVADEPIRTYLDEAVEFPREHERRQVPRTHEGEPAGVRNLSVDERDVAGFVRIGGQVAQGGGLAEGRVDLLEQAQRDLAVQIHLGQPGNGPRRRRQALGRVLRTPARLFVEPSIRVIQDRFQPLLRVPTHHHCRSSVHAHGACAITARAAGPHRPDDRRRRQLKKPMCRRVTWQQSAPTAAYGSECGWRVSVPSRAALGRLV
jgi:hypothetical protein